MLLKKVKSSIFIFALVIGIAGFPQDPPHSLPDLVDQVFKDLPANYTELHNQLEEIDGDTLALKYFQQRSEENNYLTGVVYALNQLGNYYRQTASIDRAVELHTIALNIAETNDKTDLKLISLNMLGRDFRANSAIKGALDYHQEVLNIAESIADPSTCIKRSINTAIHGIGDIYKSLEQYDLAIEFFRRSLSYEEKLRNSMGIAINYQNIGECLEAVGKLEESLKNYESSLLINENVGSERIFVKSNYGIAHILVHQGKQEEALERLKAILPAAESLDDHEILSSVYIHYGWTLLGLKQYGEAEIYLKRGLEIAEQYDLVANISQANTFLHDHAEELGDYQKALTYYKAAQRAKRRISNDRNRRYVFDVISRAESEKRSNQLEMLAKENEIVKLRLRRNKNTLLVSALLLALFTIILYILYRQYQLKNDKKLLTLEQSMLRSQMNPHFLFNSLNSIKLYIINNETKNAVHYLNKFSKLVRKILEASSLKEIPLAEELETVDLYMNIENIRFSNEINFDMKVDDNIDTHLVKIPSLILQPFLENALWHGLSAKEGDKHIELHVSNGTPGYIQIAITDNGIGRQAAERLKELKVLKRKSVGIDITKERLDNFSKDYQNNFEVEIIDLYEEADQSSAGTRVVLHIPTI